MRQIAIHLGRHVIVDYSSDIIDIYAKKPYTAYIHCIRYLEHGVYHYLVTVEAKRNVSIGVDYGWHKSLETSIRHVFYGYHAEKRFKTIHDFLKKKIEEMVHER